MRIAFLYLNAYSGIGGIQSFNRNFLLACYRLSTETDIKFSSLAYTDRKADLEKYDGIEQDSAEGSKLTFIAKAFATRSDKIILGHFNLLFPLVLFFRIFRPQLEIILIAHGIEAWQPFPFYKTLCLRLCNKILSVSNFTKNKILSAHKINPEKIVVFPNTITPAFSKQLEKANPSLVFIKHGLRGNEKILFTLCRLSQNERKKGYDQVLNILPRLKEKFPNIKYILAGKEEDIIETKRIIELTKELRIESEVILPGYLADDEIVDYYGACDIFVMPSVKEGFGIVFLEAIASGKPVIGGDKDGTKEALCEGKLGTLIDPSNQEELFDAIQHTLSGTADKKLSDSEYLQEEVRKQFGFDSFYSGFKKLIIQ